MGMARENNCYQGLVRAILWSNRETPRVQDVSLSRVRFQLRVRPRRDPLIGSAVPVGRFHESAGVWALLISVLG